MSSKEKEASEKLLILAQRPLITEIIDDYGDFLVEV